MYLRCFSLTLLLTLCALPALSESFNLVLTSATHSYLEPCGCPEQAKGGIEPRAAYFDLLRKEATPTIFLDLGGIFPEEQKDKRFVNKKMDTAIAITHAQAMKALGYDVVALGPVDLKQSYETLKALQQSSELPFISTNLKSNKEPFWKTSLVKEAGGLKVGIVALTALQAGLRLSRGEFEVLPPNIALEQEIKKLRDEQKVDAVILLAHEPPPSLVTWFPTYKGPKIDLIVGLEYGIGMRKSDETFLTNAPGRGRTLGKVSVHTEKEKGIVNAQLDRITIDPETFQDEKMRNFLSEKYESMIQDLGLVWQGEFVLQNLEEEKDPKNAYVGSAACIECHQAEHDQWSKTKHSIAFNELLNHNRHWVPECVMCHVTGSGSSTGFQTYPQSAALRHVQCETCHGPGQLHLENKGTGPIRRTPSKELCLQCHDSKNSPDFEKLYDLYYKKVTHGEEKK